jgi:hypothetical protein
MKRFTLLAICFIAVLLIGMNGTGYAQFTAGNLVIYRVGDGVSALANTGNAVFLDEYTTSGTLVQSVALPTVVSGPNFPLVAAGNASSEGLMTRSVDGQYLILAGYGASLPNATNLTTSTSATTPRIIGVVSAAAVINTTTALTDAATGSNPRGACSTDGNALWMDGGAGGARYATLGTTTSTQLSTTPTNLRGLNIFGGQLYTSSASGAFRLATIGTGTPTTSGQTTTNLPGFPTSGGSPYGFFFADLDPGTPGLDVVYVADDGGTIQKYSLVAGSWTANGTIAAPVVRCITGTVIGTSVTLYATSATTSGYTSNLLTLTDASGYNATITGTVSTLATITSTSKAFRGIAFAPASGTPAPTIQATNITFSAITATGMTASWTVGNGAKRVVIMNTTNSFTNPVDGADPSANTVYGGSGQQVVYNNSGNSVSVTGLTASTNYWFRVYEYNGSGSGTKYITTPASGNPNSQTTYGPPTVTTVAATAISSTGGTLNGTVNANGYSTVVTFDFGLTTGYGTSYTAAQSPVTGTTPTGVSYVIATGLAPNTLYHFRAVGVNSQGTINGLDMTFTTSAIAPTVTTNAATVITGTTATINGTVNANNASTVVTFDYGLTSGYGTTVTAIQSPVTGGTNTSVSYNLTGLTPNTLYHFRVNGVNIGGTSNGGDLNFTTSAIAPVAVTMSATGVGSTTASFNGTITANNSSSTVSFDYGLTIAYGTTVTGIPSPVNGMIPIPVVYNATGLAINTLYHFRVCATNSAGSSCGSDQTFTTGCPLPAPAGTITGSSSVCQTLCGYIYSVPAIANATGYAWGLPTGGTITSGANTNIITVCYSSSAISGNVSVYGTAVCGNGSPSSLAVTVNSLPMVTLAGPASVCIGSTGNVYTTQAGMSNYTWNVSAGGAVTAGGNAGSNTVTVTWNTLGPQTVSVNYTNAGGCTAASPTVFNVTVNARPTPTITGPATACAPSAGNVYTTQAGMTNYIWSVSAGGTITAGGTANSNTMTVTWNIAGAQTVCVNYNNASGCNAVAATCYAVNVNTRPVPTITGPATVCAGSIGNVYTTEAGMTGYTWSVSAGGTITAGQATNILTVTWFGTGAQTVCVNYTNGSGCNATAPTCYSVNVNAVPVPTIAGPATVCSGSTGNVYTTQTGMTNYLWTVSAGGQITAGGSTTSNSVTVKWNTAGAQTVGVNYTNAGNCSATVPASYPVTVNLTPVPTITGSNNLCVNSGYYNYITESGMTNYAWTISSGGIINFGSGTNQVTVSWVTAGAQTISVNYTAGGGCSAPTPTVKNITVNGLPGPAGTITGIPSVCAGTSGFSYSVPVITNTTTYVWNLPAGATITSGSGTNSIVVSYSTTAVSGNMTVYGNNICGSGSTSAPYPVIVVQLPGAAGTITGNNPVCQGDASVAYSVPPISNATGYEWTVPTGAVIVNGANTNSIIVNFPVPSSSGNITVYGTDFCGNGTVSPNFALTINPVPPAPVITATLNTLFSSAATGNQWYWNGALIVGATGQTYVADQSGDYTCIVTLDGCSSALSNVVNIIITGTGEKNAAGTIGVYPNPNDGQFVLEIEGTAAQETTYDLFVVNNLGVKIFELNGLKVNGNFRKNIDLRPAPNGVYTIILKNNNQNVLRKIIINK